jgi:Polysaccharide deacetylase
MSLKGFTSKLDGFVQRQAATRMHRRIFPIRAERPIISFTFDDFPISALTIGGSILRRFNSAGTYYASFGLCGKTEPSGRIFVPRDLDRLFADGHELGCHTYSHCHSWNTDSNTYERSIVKNRTALREVSPGAEFKSFSYPISPPRPRSKARTGSSFLSCRGGGQTFMADEADLNYLAAYFLEKTHGNFQPVKAIIDATVAAHDVCDHPSPYGCAPEFFERVVAYAAQSGARIEPVTPALELLGATSSSSSSVLA